MFQSIASGSSPLARGVRSWHELAQRHPGIIPARAGSTGRRAAHPAPTPDHPRSRGEHSTSWTAAGTYTGSSPLARGAPRLRPPINDPRRIIPARAGSTCNASTGRGLPGDHPRSRGEHHLTRQPVTRSWGSSPLARGARSDELGYMGLFGIIPARAGSTWHQYLRLQPCGDHPRSRGEHIAANASASIPAGSSPLARGARFNSGTVV